MMHRTCDRCGKQIRRDDIYYTLRKEAHSDGGVQAPVLSTCFGGTNNANSTEYRPEYCEACVNLAFEALKTSPTEDTRSA